MQPLEHWAAPSSQLLCQWAHPYFGRLAPAAYRGCHCHRNHHGLMQPMLRVLLHQGLLRPMLVHHGRGLLHLGLLVPAAMMQLVPLHQWRMLLHHGLLVPAAMIDFVLPLPAALSYVELVCY